MYILKDIFSEHCEMWILCNMDPLDPQHWANAAHKIVHVDLMSFLQPYASIEIPKTVQGMGKN